MRYDTFKKINAILAFTLLSYFVFAPIMKRSGKIVKAYENLIIAGKISSIIDYNRGRPTVIIQGDKITLKTTFDLRNYLQAGDSVVKKANSTDITVMRDSADFRIISLWSIDKANDETGRGFIKNISVKKENKTVLP